MIEQSDIEIVDKEYFEIIGEKDYTLVLRSRNTGHHWCLLEQVYNGYRTFQISHRHHMTGPYHIQTNRPSISVCCEYIRSHDAYHLEREKRKEERRARRAVYKNSPLPG